MPTSQKQIGMSTRRTNPTISIPSRSVLAWLTPSPIQTRIPERNAFTNPAAVKTADERNPPNQSSAAVMNSGGG